MSEGRDFFRLFDPDMKSQPGCFHVADYSEACEWNERQWGIFWTLNSFHNHKRTKENLKDILAWGVDLDSGTKAEQRERIKKFLTPSAIIETKRGYQVYYDAVDGTPEKWNDIVVERLVFSLQGDANARDLCRILRVPATLHWKDPKNPFAIKSVYTSNKRYTQKEMLLCFPTAKKEIQVQRKEMHQVVQSFSKDKDLFERIWSMDCEQALLRISGHHGVNFESYSFKRAPRGRLNIFVNGQGTACFVDEFKRIGSLDKGGPTIWQWINWHQRDHKKTYEIMKQVFPEVFSS